MPIFFMNEDRDILNISNNIIRLNLYCLYPPLSIYRYICMKCEKLPSHFCKNATKCPPLSLSIQF